jgi:hypothetical protein
MLVAAVEHLLMPVVVPLLKLEALEEQVVGAMGQAHLHLLR